MRTIILTIALSLMVLATTLLTGCSTENPYNPFVCESQPRDELMLNSLQAQKINPEAIATGVNLGSVQVSASTFTVNTQFLNIVNIAVSKLGTHDILVVYTDIDACNQMQYLYAKFILTQVISHGLKTNKLIFVDKKSNDILQDGKEATINFEFIVVDKTKL